MKLLISISAFLFSLNIMAQKEDKITSKWYDGSKGSEFPSASDYTPVKKGLVLYCISNDDRNIYVDIKVTESIEQSKILQSGSTLWINADGKSRKIDGIRFPLGAKYSKLRPNPGENQGTSNLVKPSALSLANTIELIGFKGVAVKRFPSNNQDNIHGNIRYDNDGNLLYTVIVPTSALPAVERNGEPAKSFTFAIEYGAPPYVAGQQQGFAGSGSASGGSGGGGRSGGRSGGGSRGGSSGGSLGSGPAYQEKPQSEIVWIKKISLAEKK